MAHAPDHTIDSFEKLGDWLARLPDQTDGNSRGRCETGEEYQEFYSGGYARPGDEKLVESMVAAVMRRQLETYFKGRNGRIYWRIRLEQNVADTPIVLRYDVNGPDVDHILEQRCFKDHNMKTVKMYCRLYRATHSVPGTFVFQEVIAA